MLLAFHLLFSCANGVDNYLCMGGFFEIISRRRPNQSILSPGHVRLLLEGGLKFASLVVYLWGWGYLYLAEISNRISWQSVFTVWLRFVLWFDILLLLEKESVFYYCTQLKLTKTKDEIKLFQTGFHSRKIVLCVFLANNFFYLAAHLFCTE